MTEELGFRIFANAQEAERALIALEKKYDNLANKVKHVHRESKTLKDQAITGAKNWAIGLAQTAAGYLAITNLLPRLISLEKERADTARETERTIDSANKKLMVQARLKNAESPQVRRDVSLIATKWGVSIPQAMDTSRELVSQGFSVKDSTGGALDEQLKMQAASNQLQTDAPEQFVKSISKYLMARGHALNVENQKRVDKMFINLFADKPIQAPDLEFIAGSSAITRGVLSDEEDLALATTAIQGTTPEKAALQRRNMLMKLRNFRGSKKETKLLSKLGLKPEDVDLIGENLEQVQSKFVAGVSKLAPEEVSPTLQGLFGTRANELALQFFDPNAKDHNRYLENLTALRRGGDYERMAEIGSSGMEARTQRQTNEAAMLNEELGKQWDDFEAALKEMDNVLKNEGYGATRRGIAEITARASYYMSGIGRSDDDPSTRAQRIGSAIEEGLPDFSLINRGLTAQLIIQEAEKKKSGVQPVKVVQDARVPARAGQGE